MNTPYMIDWAITNRCNLNCLHCRGMAKEQLDGRTILRVVKEIALLKPRWVIIEGGEPLLRKELFEILEMIHKSNIKIYLITNGMLLNTEIVKRFAELSINLMISIDGADKESYEKIRIGAKFEKLKEVVGIANEYEVLDSCPVTIGKYNYKQISELFQFVKEIGYRKITFIGLKPCGDYEKYVLKDKEYEEFFFSLIKNQKAYKMGVNVDEPFFKPFLKEHNINYLANEENGIVVHDVSRCIFGEYIFIETNGDVKPCTFAPIVMGNVKEKSVIEIWEEIQGVDLIKKLKCFATRKNPCKKCKYLYECGGCRARTFALTNDWMAGDPSCPLKEVVCEL